MKRRLYTILIILDIIFILFLIMQIVGYYVGNRNGEHEVDVLRYKIEQDMTSGNVDITNEEQSEKISKYSKLKRKNLVAWITDGKSIDYPVMYCKDEYYLHRDIKGKYSYQGSIFTQQLLNDEVIFLYGHNMRVGTMFGTLNRYKDKTNWNDFIFSDLKKDYKVTPVAYCIVDTEKIALTAENMTKEVLADSLVTGSLDDLSNDRLLVLCTCEKGTNRAILIGKINESNS